METTRVCTLMITHSCNLNCIYCFEKFKSNQKMSFDVAIGILEREFALFENEKGRLAIEFFGGEPLTNISLIKQIYDWVKKKKPTIDYVFQITTNGTLLTDDIKEWLIERKNDFRIVMSVDGTEAMQMGNRGCKLSDLPIDYVRNVWPNSYFKMTLSSDTLCEYAKGLISLYEKGFNIASSLAEGQTWKNGDAEIYRTQLNQIGDYFLSHPDKIVQHPFNFLFKMYLDQSVNKLPWKNCGVGTTIKMYDIDGKLYPCHLFLPMVHGNKHVLNEIANINFTNHELIIDEDCKCCPALKICKTCYGYNFIQRNNVIKRDKSMCSLRLVEAQEVSAFEVKYLMNKKEKLSSYELLMLKAALRCYQQIKDIVL